MISITTKSPYALRALAELARCGDGPGADRRAGPPPRHPGAVPRAAVRDAAPGRRPAAPSAASRAATPSPASPSTITVLEIVELLDGPLGRDAEGVFGEAAAAARDGARADHDRRRDRARARATPARRCTTSRTASRSGPRSCALSGCIEIGIPAKISFRMTRISGMLRGAQHAAACCAVRRGSIGSNHQGGERVPEKARTSCRGFGHGRCDGLRSVRRFCKREEDLQEAEGCDHQAAS